MHIEDLGCGDTNGDEIEISNNSNLGLVTAKRAAVAVGARMLFYPTLLYNVVRNRFEPQFHWWDQVDEFLLLGAVPFPSDVLRLKKLGVGGVITLNEPYETIVPTCLYNEHGIENLVLPTRDYLFAPSFDNLCKAVDFIHRNAANKKMTYVHCKAGRGRSTTVVLCYLVQHKQMTPTEAYEYVRFQRPRVLLASSQWQAVQEFYRLRVLKVDKSCCTDRSIANHHFLVPTSRTDFISFHENTFVIVSQADLEGYNADFATKNMNSNSIPSELSFVCRLSYFWLRCQSQRKLKKIAVCDMKAIESCSLVAEQGIALKPCAKLCLHLDSPKDQFIKSPQVRKWQHKWGDIVLVNEVPDDLLVNSSTDAILVGSQLLYSSKLTLLPNIIWHISCSCHVGSCSGDNLKSYMLCYDVWFVQQT